jgi:hypothetical protein
MSDSSAKSGCLIVPPPRASDRRQPLRPLIQGIRDITLAGGVLPGELWAQSACRSHCAQEPIHAPDEKKGLLWNAGQPPAHPRRSPTMAGHLLSIALFARAPACTTFARAGFHDLPGACISLQSESNAAMATIRRAWIPAAGNSSTGNRRGARGTGRSSAREGSRQVEQEPQLWEGASSATASADSGTKMKECPERWRRHPPCFRGSTPSIAECRSLLTALPSSWRR